MQGLAAGTKCSGPEGSGRAVIGSRGGGMLRPSTSQPGHGDGGERRCVPSREPGHREALGVKTSAFEAPEVPRRGEASQVPGEASRGAGAQEWRPARRDAGPRASRPTYRAEDFPGCESFPLPAGALEGYEGRLEFWDGLTETAWKVSEPTSPRHEGPSPGGSRG